jgi:hypothetical protein
MLDPDSGAVRRYDPNRDFLGAPTNPSFSEHEGVFDLLGEDDSCAVVVAASWARYRRDWSPGAASTGWARNFIPGDRWYDAWPDLYEFDDPRGLCRADIGGHFGKNYSVRWDLKRVLYRVSQEGEQRSRIVVERDPQQMAAFWDEIEQVGALSWAGSYVAPDVLDGTHWSVRLSHERSVVEADGSNA